MEQMMAQFVRKQEERHQREMEVLKNDFFQKVHTVQTLAEMQQQTAIQHFQQQCELRDQVVTEQRQQMQILAAQAESAIHREKQMAEQGSGALQRFQTAILEQQHAMQVREVAQARTFTDEMAQLQANGEARDAQVKEFVERTRQKEIENHGRTERERQEFQEYAAHKDRQLAELMQTAKAEQDTVTQLRMFEASAKYWIEAAKTEGGEEAAQAAQNLRFGMAMQEQIRQANEELQMYDRANKTQARALQLVEQKAHEQQQAFLEFQANITTEIQKQSEVNQQKTRWAEEVAAHEALKEAEKKRKEWAENVAEQVAASLPMPSPMFWGMHEEPAQNGQPRGRDPTPRAVQGGAIPVYDPVRVQPPGLGGGS
jgi:hypothetical protein